MGGAKDASAEPEDGASLNEILLEACRRDNTDLLQEVLSSKICNAKFLNDATDGMGNHALHVGAQYGSHDVIDMLLDQEGLEVDPTNRMEQDTPLHVAVVYASEKNAELGKAIVEMLIDAGSDPRIRNKRKQKPIDLVDPRQTELRSVLQKAEYAQMVGNDVVQDNDSDEGEGGTGSESE